MAEIINQGETIAPNKKRKWLSLIILLAVIIILALAGYFIYWRENNVSFEPEENSFSVNRLDYKKPYGVFADLPIEGEVSLEDSALVSYENGEEVRTIAYKSLKTSAELFSDFLNFFEFQGWSIENKTENSFIYAVKNSETFSVLLERDLEKTSVNISYFREKEGE